MSKWDRVWEQLKVRMETVAVGAVMAILFGGEELWDRYREHSHEVEDRATMQREYEAWQRLEYELLMRWHDAEARADSCEAQHE